MDDRRFDNWARTVAGIGSRRRVLGGLAGVAGAALLGAFRRGAPDVSAHHGSSGPGDPCRHDNQCLGADAPLVCAWNGVDYDGDLNCCTYEGNRCGFDEACCGLATCFNGFCSSAGSASAGGGGVATSSAEGGTVFVGDINSGGNVGNTISVGNTTGSVDVSGGSVSNVTDVSVSADGGIAIADADGGYGNVAGSGPASGSWANCTGQGCACWQGPYDDDPCDYGLVCCIDTDNSGVCVTLYDCTGYGVSGDVCPSYCGAGNQCPSCVSGYCTWNGYCG